MLTEFLEQNHCQQVWPRPAAGRHMERRRRLANAVTVAAGEFLPHGLDHLQAFGHVLAQLGQACPTTAVACNRSRDDDPLAWQVRRKGAAGGVLAVEGIDAAGLGSGLLGGQFICTRRCRQFLQLQFQLCQQPCGALRAGAETVAVEFGDFQFQIGDQRLVTAALRLSSGHLGKSCNQRCLQRLDIVRQVCKIIIHEAKWIIRFVTGASSF
jgi:hypothetical protein